MVAWVVSTMMVFSWIMAERCLEMVSARMGLAPLVISSLAESDDVDLDDLNGVRVPCKVGPDLDLSAEALPTVPCRASMLLGGCNICLKFPRLCNAEVTEVIISDLLWQSVQGVSWGYTELK